MHGRMKPALALGLAALGLLAPGAARAGTFDVVACTVAGTTYDNRSFALEGPLPIGIENDKDCPVPTQNIDLGVRPGARTPDGAEATFAFRAPPGTSIAGFRLDRRLTFNDPAPAGTHRYYAIYALGAKVFAGAGDYDDATRNALNAQRSWYGYPDNPADTKRGLVTQASFPALAGYRGDAATLALKVGCFRRGTPCGMGPGGIVDHSLFGAQITLSDPTPPSEFVVEASGLFAGGERNGADPVRIGRATDNTGIRRAQVVDVTDPAAPRVVAAEDYFTQASGTRTDQGASCAYRLTHPCPNLVGETLTPTSLQAGVRRVAVRIADAGGNTLQSPTQTVVVRTPSDRGAPNGANTTDAGTITASFTRGRSRLTANFGVKSTVTGRLVNASGAPISGAEVRVLTRDADRDGYVDRGAIRTDASGAFAYRASAYANRLLQFAWRARANDPGFAANAYVTMRVRAGATLRANKRTVSLRRKVTLRGTLYGRRLSGVDVVLEGRGSGERAYRTFDRTRTRKGGRFSASVRFLRPASRGKSFSIRARVLPTGRFPYLRGVSRTARVRIR
jgi:hypothetical protein